MEKKSLARRLRAASNETMQPKPTSPMSAMRKPTGMRLKIRVKSATMPMMPIVVALIRARPP